VRVVEDGQSGLMVWLPPDTPTKTVMSADGRRPRRLADQQGITWHIVDSHWRRTEVLQWFPPDGSAYSVWWFFEAGRFQGWYVNLEDPAVRWSSGVDTSDHALDIQVTPDRVWRLKDEDEFIERIGHPWFWSSEQATVIRAQAQRAIGLIEAGAFPFDGSWCDFRPAAGWEVPRMLPEWCEPRARPSQIDDFH
jgi:predicted RNA-binding protein associated with RNAse of E/G family